MRWPWSKDKEVANFREAVERAMPYPNAAVDRNAPKYPADMADTRSPASELPYWPGDHECGGNEECECSWEIETVFEGPDEVTYTTWKLGHSGCSICRKRAAEWKHVETERTPRKDR